MSNTVWSGALRAEEIHMSNGLTDVFINVLVLSGSALAVTDDEKRIIVWLAEKDQSSVGMGTVGFDICGLPWNKNAFAGNKRFLLNVIEAAKSKDNWFFLDYEPNEELLFPCLDRFSKLISALECIDIDPMALHKWLSAADASDPVLSDFPKCSKHGALLSCFGCQICNN